MNESHDSAMTRRYFLTTAGTAVGGLVATTRLPLAWAAPTDPSGATPAAQFGPRWFETACSVRWWSSKAEHVPSSPTLTVAPPDQVYVPKLRNREAFFSDMVYSYHPDNGGNRRKVGAGDRQGGRGSGRDLLARVRSVTDGNGH